MDGNLDDLRLLFSLFSLLLNRMGSCLGGFAQEETTLGILLDYRYSI